MRVDRKTTDKCKCRAFPEWRHSNFYVKSPFHLTHDTRASLFGGPRNILRHFRLSLYEQQYAAP